MRIRQHDRIVPMRDVPMREVPMTEAEWLASANPSDMLHCHWQGVSDRKFRLFAAACCRRIWQRMTDERARKMVEVTERHADQLASNEEWRDAGSGVLLAWEESLTFMMSEADKTVGMRAAHYATSAAWWLSPGGVLRHGWGPFWADQVAHDTATAVHNDYIKSPEHAPQCALWRDIRGNPFRSPTLDPSCVTPSVQALATAIYAPKSFGDVPVLADALEEAGCRDGDILGHLRQPGEHVRGCWALDLLLGKT